MRQHHINANVITYVQDAIAGSDTRKKPRAANDLDRNDEMNCQNFCMSQHFFSLDLLTVQLSRNVSPKCILLWRMTF